MTAAFDVVMTTRTELIQQAIDGIRNDRRRARLQRKFETNPQKVADRLTTRCIECDSYDCDDLAEFLEVGNVRAIDPETLKRWIEIIKVLLPIILAFL